MNPTEQSSGKSFTPARANSSVSIAFGAEADAREIYAELRSFNSKAVKDIEFVPVWLVARDQGEILQGGSRWRGLSWVARN